MFWFTKARGIASHDTPTAFNEFSEFCGNRSRSICSEINSDKTQVNELIATIEKDTAVIVFVQLLNSRGFVSQ